MLEVDLSNPFARFEWQGSGCVAYGVEHEGGRLFVKVARTAAAEVSLHRAMAVHAAVRHPAIVAPIEGGETERGSRLVYPWREGTVLNAATRDGSDRRALTRFRMLPVAEIERAIDAVLDAHLAVAEAGFVAVDLYDGCFHYDFVARRIWLIDLDEYRPGPFAVEGERLPGSTRFMAPEELRHGAVIDERTTVFNLGRTIQHLLAADSGDWRGSASQAALADEATRSRPDERVGSVRTLAARWRATSTT